MEISICAIGKGETRTPLAPGESYTVTRSIIVPETTGKPYLLFVSDRHNFQYESDECNNIRTVAIEGADLVVTDLVAPTTTQQGRNYRCQLDCLQPRSGGCRSGLERSHLSPPRTTS